MTDPLPVAASVAGLVSLAGAVLSKCYTFTCGVANAPNEAKRLADEVTNLAGILAAVQGITSYSEHDVDTKDITNALRSRETTLLEL
jgi:hypothetical protein